MLDMTTLEHALRFLGRCTLQGDEVPAFVNVTNALHAERHARMQPPMPVSPTKDETVNDVDPQ